MRFHIDQYLSNHFHVAFHSDEVMRVDIQPHRAARLCSFV
jgi:hypothetical protein